MIVTRSFIPNLFTLANLFSGFTAIIYISNSDFRLAAAFILFAAIFDSLDGIAARLFNATSELGAELDSLCDTVSFGVAPSYMLYEVYFYQIGDFGILISALPALAGAIRLARYNVMFISLDDKDYFAGMPIPSAALAIVSYVVFFHLDPSINMGLKEVTIYSIPIVIPACMISRIKFDNLPRPTKKSFKKRPGASIIFIIGLIAAVVSQGKFVFPFFVLYIVISATRQLIIWAKEKREVADDFDESEEIDQDAYKF